MRQVIHLKAELVTVGALLAGRTYTASSPRYHTQAHPPHCKKKILEEFIELLKKCKHKITSEEIQSEIYEIGKKYKYELKDWFLLLYEILLGQKNGPRLGTFILLLSIKETIKLIEDSFSR